MQDKQAVLAAIAYIEANLGEDIRLDDIAAQTGYSKFHLNRLFSEQVGSTVYKYVQTRRLTEAARALAQTGRPILDIALDACYSSQQAFTNAFTAVYGISPQAYRQSGCFCVLQNRYGAA